MRIYYLNKHWDAAGFGHAGVIIPTEPDGYRYYSFFASRKFVPLCPGTLLVKDFPNADEALAYAKHEGYTREVHWPIDPPHAALARSAVEQYATGTPWRLLGRNCWNAVHAALKAANIQLHPTRGWPNRHFHKNKPHAEGWSHL